MTKAVIGSVFMAILLVLYMWVAGYQGYVMITSGNGIVIAMGVALLVLPVVGVWALVILRRDRFCDHPPFLMK